MPQQPRHHRRMPEARRRMDCLVDPRVPPSLVDQLQDFEIATQRRMIAERNAVDPRSIG